jgi:DNA-binding MarR family transcriptional regulator
MGGCKPEIVEVKPTESCGAQIEEIKPIESEQPIEEASEPEPELTEQQKKVLDCFKSESDISMAEAGRRLEMSYKTVKKYKDQLIEMGML